LPAVHALPFIFSLFAAAVLTPLLLKRLAAVGVTRENYRGRELPAALGVVIVPAALFALIPLTLFDRFGDVDVYPDNFTLAMLFIPGVALLGLIDDVLSGSGRGWRGHGRDLLSGGLSTGAVKAVGTLGLALFVASYLRGSDGEFLLAVAVLVLATNASNLLDLRPGRSVKAFVLLGIGLTLSTQNFEAAASLGIFAAPVLIAGFFDLRERAMFGDVGSNAIGAMAGLWMVLTLDANGQLIALVLLAALNVFGEFRSISAVIEKVPGLRHLDSIGRPK
jgi:UDP-N-acetylmuramyl pentapeptide phosphotransferase/UDP-N-acetylglucosamine-1-phosphate transferase